MVGAGAVDAVFPAGLPEDLVAAEEGEVDARFARRFHVLALLRRPVLVVAHRQVGLVLEDLIAAAVGVDTGEVADVVAVALQPADHRVLGVERRVLGGRAADGEGTVVADLVRPAGRDPRPALVEAVAAVAVVGLPGRVRGLEEQVRVTVVVADDEDDVAAVRRLVFPHELGEIDARDSAGRDRPGGGLRPVAAIDQARFRIRCRTAAGPAAAASRGARCRPGERRHRRSSPCGRCRGGRRSTAVSILKWTVSPRLTLMSVAKPWMVGIFFAVHVPLAGRVARFGVLADDGVDQRRAGVRSRLACPGTQGAER